VEPRHPGGEVAVVEVILLQHVRRVGARRSLEADVDLQPREPVTGAHAVDRADERPFVRGEADASCSSRRGEETHSESRRQDSYE
jgi:hypothetical protein